MPLETYFHRLADDGHARNGWENALQAILTAATPFYAAGAAVNRIAHDSGLATRQSLPATVLSVGNITVGGTGKTPFCVWMAKWLQAEGRRPAILTRGYRRADEDRMVVVHDGRKLRASITEGGDEPVMLAKLLGDIPVIACADRFRAGKLALKKFKVDTLLLDDGFQHHDLARQGDVVLVDSTKPLASLRMLPRGTLRESPSVLNRAHLIVLTRWNQANQPKRVLKEVRSYAPGVAVCRTNMNVDNVRLYHTGEAVNPEDLKGKAVGAVCGVGNPESVHSSLNQLGIDVTSFRTLGDHAHATPGMLRAALKPRKGRRPEFVVITDKDAVKLDKIRGVPENVLVIGSRIDFVSSKDEAIAEKAIRARLHAKLIRGYLA